MKVLIADKFPDSGQSALSAAGCEVIYEPELKDDTLAQALTFTAADVLVVRSTRVTKDMLETGHLSLVVRAGAGFNTIDVQTASALGIYVANCPGKNSIAVAELAFGLILALDRRIYENTADLKLGKWNKKEYSKARGIFGRTLGIIGLGRIGHAMVPRAKAFGMNVVAWSRSLTPEIAKDLGIEWKNTPEEVASISDVVSILLSLNADTRTLIGEKFFQAMKPGAFFINTSRAEVVDPGSLSKAIAERNIRAALDVFPAEPATGSGTIEYPLSGNENVIGTHHIGASTEQAQQSIADETIRIIREFKETGRPPNVVNLAKKSPATHMLVVRHFDRIGVLAGVFDQIKAAGVNVEETDNVVFEGAAAAVAHIHLDQQLPDEVLETIESSSDDIIDVSLVRL